MPIASEPRGSNQEGLTDAVLRGAYINTKTYALDRSCVHTTYKSLASISSPEYTASGTDRHPVTLLSRDCDTLVTAPAR